MRLTDILPLLEPLIEVVARSQTASFEAIATSLASRADQAARSAQRDSDRLIDESIETLIHAGLLIQHSPHRFTLTNRGQQIAATGGPIELDTLAQAAGFEEWLEIQEMRGEAGRPSLIADREFSGFDHLAIERWRQYLAVDIYFHPQLTVLTGANGSGKTTLMNILGRHFDWNVQLLASRTKRGWRAHTSQDSGGDTAEVGSLRYRWGARSRILATSVADAPSFETYLDNQQVIPGLFISSHRALGTYQQLGSLPVRFDSTEVIYNQFANEVRSRYRSQGGTGTTPHLLMKQALIAAAIFGEGNRAIQADPEAEAVWVGFQRVLEAVLPKQLRFLELTVEPPDLFVRTETGDFLLEALSGGLSAIFELAWQIFLRSRNYSSFTVCIDEPENHLHPELQRTLVPSLLEAFPGISFVIATHSPFIITSVRDSNVYTLLPGPDGVESHLVPEWNRSGTPDAILLEVLGLDTTLPRWTQLEVNRILADVPLAPTASDLRRLRDALSAAGLRDQFPAALDSIEDLG